MADVLGINIKDFALETGYSQPFLCSENVEEKKPSLEGFLKIISISRQKPKNIIYVGDSLTKDIKPSLILGMKAAHVVWKGEQVSERDGYVELPTIYHLPQYLTRG